VRGRNDATQRGSSIAVNDSAQLYRSACVVMDGPTPKSKTLALEVEIKLQLWKKSNMQ